MTTDYTPSVEPFEVSTPYGVCKVRDTRVPYENSEFARVQFANGALTVNGKNYTGSVDFTLSPPKGPHNRGNGVYVAAVEGYYNSGLTEKASDKLREYLTGPEVLNALKRIGILAPVDPAEIRDYKRERMYSNVTYALRGVVTKDMDYNLPAEERQAITDLKTELMDEVLVRIVSRRLDGMTWQAIESGDYENAK